MFENFKGKNKRMIVGINIKSMHTTVPDFAVDMALRTGMTLRFVYVLEYSLLGYPYIYPDEYVSTQWAMDFKEELIEDAMESLDKIKNDFQKSKNINIETKAVIGNVADCLQAEAIATNASLIMCGAKVTSHKFTPKGLSTALSLMSHSKKPTIVIPESCERDFSKQHITILAADDLTDNSFEAINVACELAFNQGNTDVVHFYITPQTKDEMEMWAEKILEYMIANELEYKEDMVRQSSFEAVSKNINKKMDNRLGMLKNVMVTAPNVQYKQLVRFGDVMEQFNDVVSEYKPDLIVFGRHHFIHNKPWAFGKMPFYAMLNLNCPVMVVAGR